MSEAATQKTRRVSERSPEVQGVVWFTVMVGIWSAFSALLTEWLRLLIVALLGAMCTVVAGLRVRR